MGGSTTSFSGAGATGVANKATISWQEEQAITWHKCKAQSYRECY
jgi:hypothetical protein